MVVWLARRDVFDLVNVGNVCLHVLSLADRFDIVIIPRYFVNAIWYSAELSWAPEDLG